jgi:arsenical pump membrane protein
VSAAGLVLLAFAVGGALLRPRGTPAWVAPAVAVGLAFAFGTVDASTARAAVDPLVEPLAFVAVAVPLAVLLDDVGFFSALAERAAGRRNLGRSLWILAAATTALLNLDAAIVLLTPLYVRVARRTGNDALAFSLMPVLLACLASSFLPVSNLTNLIAADLHDLGPQDFLANLALPSAVAVVTGWRCYSRAYPSRDDTGHPHPVDRTALRVGGTAAAVLVVGLTATTAAGLPAWVVALVVLAGLAVVRRDLPWRSAPAGIVVIALALGILTEAAFDDVPQLHGLSVPELALVVVVFAVAANLCNNLPAALVGLGPAHATGGAVWALLLGVNAGPVLVVTGSLASLLWLDSARRLDVDVGPRQFARAGARIGLPALAAATATFLLLQAVFFR